MQFPAGERARALDGAGLLQYFDWSIQPVKVSSPCVQSRPPRRKRISPVCSTRSSAARQSSSLVMASQSPVSSPRQTTAERGSRARWPRLRNSARRCRSLPWRKFSRLVTTVISTDALRHRRLGRYMLAHARRASPGRRAFALASDRRRRSKRRACWWFELRNVLIVSERRGRLDPRKTDRGAAPARCAADRDRRRRRRRPRRDAAGATPSPHRLRRRLSRTRPTQANPARHARCVALAKAARLEERVSQLIGDAEL